MRGGCLIGVKVVVWFDVKLCGRVCVRLGCVLLTTPQMERDGSGSVKTHVDAEH